MEKIKRNLLVCLIILAVFVVGNSLIAHNNHAGSLEANLFGLNGAGAGGVVQYAQKGGGGGGHYATIQNSPSGGSDESQPVVSGDLNDGAPVPICTDPKALNYQASFGQSDPSKCIYATAPVVPTNTVPAGNSGSSSDCPFFGYSRLGSIGKNVAKIQTFLNQYMNTHLVVDSKYGNSTAQAVSNFQLLYQNTVLKPWYLNGPTGYFYKTTAGVANIIVGCQVPPAWLEGPNVVYSFNSFVPLPSFPKVTTASLNVP